MTFQLASDFVSASMFALNGQDAVGVVVSADGEWADGLDEVSDIEAFELDGASYTRLEGTFTVERIADEWLLFVEGFTAIDTSDSDARVGVWLATDDGTLVGFEDDDGSPTGSYLPAWPDGVFARPIAPVTLTAGVQSVTGTAVDNTDPANPVVDLPGGGGIESIVAGTNVTVDDTDPANPIISAAGGGGGSGLTPRVGTNVTTGALPIADDLLVLWVAPIEGPIVPPSGPFAEVGIVHPDHCPPGQVQVAAMWAGAAGTGFAQVLVDGLGSTGSAPGAILAIDASGTLTDSDSVLLWILGGWGVPL